MGTPLATTWASRTRWYAVHTLNAADYRTLGIYDCDISGTVESLREAAERFIATFEDLDAATFIEWN